MSEYEVEPIRGLPEPLPDGEHILWQGAPDWKSLARRVFHTRLIVAYFGILVVWRIASMTYDGFPLKEIALSVLWLVLIAVAALVIVTVLARLMANTTVYTITERRVVFRFGVALPMAINLPFRTVKSAAVMVDRAGVGDIALTLSAPNRVAYLVLWPHIRPWRFSPVQPALRAIPDADSVADILSTALAKAVSVPVGETPAATSPKPADAPASTAPESTTTTAAFAVTAH